MKRFALVALLAAMFFGVASSASAAELKARANLDVYTTFSQNLRDLNDDSSDRDNNVIDQRVRMYFDYITNENLKAVVGFEMDTAWGTDMNAGGDVATRNGGIDVLELKHAYLDFNFPDTTINVKAGLLPVALPGVFGSPVHDEDAPAFVVSTPINDMFAVTAGFVRHLDGDNSDQANTNGSGNADDEVDFAFIATPVTLDGFALIPYFVYGWMGGDLYTGAPNFDRNNIIVANGESGNAWWLGANAELTMFDPFTFEADLIYGAVNNDNEVVEQKGWFTALAASYKMDMVTPKLFFTYASGDDSDWRDGGETMPSIVEGFDFAPYTGSRAFGGTTETWGPLPANGVGMWSIGLKLLDISFIENLSHELTIAYMEGTNEYDVRARGGIVQDRATFTDEDSAWEVYFVNNYKIYENLAAIVELGYFKADLEDRVAGAGQTPDDASSFMALGFQYKF